MAGARTNLMILTRLLIALSGAVLAAAIFWAMGADGRPLGVVLGEMTSDPWTVVTLVDLYLGFILSAVVILLAEKRLAVGLLWAAPVFLLGNVWTAVWFILRLPSLVARLRGG